VLSEAVEQALVNGDLSKLTSPQRVELYQAKCSSLGLNPLTNPFLYVNLSGKLVLYVTKDGTEQLRKINGLSVALIDRQRMDDVYIVTARATTPNGRTDESTGAVTVGNLKGDALCNALMKAETKSKRRVTLSICGLGMLDETEIETIRDAEKVTFNDLPPSNLRPVAAGPKRTVEPAEAPMPADEIEATEQQAVDPAAGVQLMGYYASRLEKLEAGDTKLLADVRAEALKDRHQLSEDQTAQLRDLLAQTAERIRTVDAEAVPA